MWDTRQGVGKPVPRGDSGSSGTLCVTTLTENNYSRSGVVNSFFLLGIFSTFYAEKNKIKFF